MRFRIVAGALAWLLGGSVAVGPIGCGSGRPPPSTDGVLGPSTQVSDSPSLGGGGGGDVLPPGCGKTESGASCDCLDVDLFGERPNLYFVLDRSGSMAEGGKWDQVRVTVATILRALGPRANFGVTVFPNYTDVCDPGVEIVSTRAGDRPSATADGPTTLAFIESSRAYPPGGGTPTAATLQELPTRLSSLSGKTYVILATDGGPNCSTVSCSVDRCMPNIEGQPGCPPGGPNCCDEAPTACLDQDATLSAVQALRYSGFPVYVVGIPGSAPYGPLLDQMAEVGGTAQPGATKYFRVDATGQLLATLKKVAAEIVATCEYDLKEAPKDSNQVNVYLDNVVLPREPVDGWKIQGAKVTLVGAACTRVLSGDVLDVRIIAGCPTVTPR